MISGQELKTLIMSLEIHAVMPFKNWNQNEIEPIMQLELRGYGIAFALHSFYLSLC